MTPFRKPCVLILLLSLLAVADSSRGLQTEPTAKFDAIYDRQKDQTTVRLLPIKIAIDKAQYHSVHISPAFSYPGQTFKKPEFIDFEVQTVVKTKLNSDLYVVFVFDDETIFLSSNRWAVKRPVPGKRWVGERLVFRMPYETLLKLTKSKTVEIKMGGVVFPLSEAVLEQIRQFADQAKG